MATMVKLQRQKEDFVDEAYRRQNEAEQQREEEYASIVLVQAWYRGTRSRAYIRHLNKCATQIQRRWRGFLGRGRVRQLLQEQVFIMKLNHFNEMATKIQKVWRGFYVRKYVSNYYSRKRYLEGLIIKNEVVRQELEDYVEQQELTSQIKRDKEADAELEEYAKKHHYLLSTHVMPGVYNSPARMYPDKLEFHLRNAKTLLAEEAKAKAKKKSKSPRLSRENTFDPAHQRYDLPRLKDPLPPVQTRPQGPFREPDSVQQQRYKAFQPSLRVATDFYSLEKARETMKDEEWITRLNDNGFEPFSKRNVPYEKLLHSTSGYGHLSYGTQYFRHEYPDKFTSKNFQSVVPPVPIFDKLNDTYSQGQV